jgi:hypothetical protein
MESDEPAPEESVPVGYNNSLPLSSGTFNKMGFGSNLSRPEARPTMPLFSTSFAQSVSAVSSRAFQPLPPATPLPSVINTALPSSFTFTAAAVRAVPPLSTPCSPQAGNITFPTNLLAPQGGNAAASPTRRFDHRPNKNPRGRNLGFGTATAIPERPSLSPSLLGKIELLYLRRVQSRLKLP